MEIASVSFSVRSWILQWNPRSGKFNKSRNFLLNWIFKIPFYSSFLSRYACFWTRMIYMNESTWTLLNLFHKHQLKAFKSKLEVFWDNWGCLEVIGDDWCCFRLIEGFSGMTGAGRSWLVVALAAWMWFGKLHTATSASICPV